VVVQPIGGVMVEAAIGGQEVVKLSV
jgi:hypothetical protein